MTELNGIRADRVSAFSWALSSLFAGLAGVLIAPRFNTLAAPDFFNLVVVAVAAAAVGRLVSLPRALLGGIGLGHPHRDLQHVPAPVGRRPRLAAGRSQDNLTPAMPFVVLFGVLVLWPAIRRTHESLRSPRRGRSAPAGPGRAVPEPRDDAWRPGPSASRSSIVAGYVVFFRADASWLFLVTQAVILSIIFLSITVITGFAGQISLCQGTFAAIGGFTVFQLFDRFGLPVLAAAVIGAAIAAAIGALLSLPVLRLGGVWVAIATLAFAFFFDAVMVKLSWVGGGTGVAAARDPRPAPDHRLLGTWPTTGPSWSSP